MPTNIQQLATALDVLRRMGTDEARRRRELNSQQSEHWDRVEYELRTLMEAVMRDAPAGAGIDCGTTLCEQVCSATRIELYCEFHHMNEHGMYDAWTRHPITIAPTFDGIAVRIGGRDRNGIKDYLADTYYHWATSECPHKLTLPPRD